MVEGEGAAVVVGSGTGWRRGCGWWRRRWWWFWFLAVVVGLDLSFVCVGSMGVGGSEAAKMRLWLVLLCAISRMKGNGGIGPMGKKDYS